MSIQVPRLPIGKGFKGPEYPGCFNTGMAPAIFHSRQGKYVVGREMPCRDAMRNSLPQSSKRCHGEGNRKVFIFKGRKAAVNKFLALCGAAILENNRVRSEYRETLDKARKGDMAAVLALGDY
jgi:hypothetical protein